MGQGGESRALFISVRTIRVAFTVPVGQLTCLMRRLADSRSGKESCVMPISREPRCRAEDACRSAYRRRAGDRRVDGDLPTRAAGREPSAWTGCGVPCCRRYWRSSRRATSRSSRRSLPPNSAAHTRPGRAARNFRFAACLRWTETLSRRSNSPPPHRNRQAHENAVASVATVLAMTPTEAAATATPVRVRHRRILRNDTNGLPARGRRGSHFRNRKQKPQY